MKFFLFFLLFLSQTSYAYFFTTGTYVPFFNRAQTSNQGARQTFDYNPYFSGGVHIPLTQLNYFSPELGYSFYLENAKNTKVDVIFLHYSFSYFISSHIVFRYGFTNNWYRLVGKGGTVSLSNGTGTTTFPSPSKTVISYFSTLDFGLEYIYTNKRYSTRLDFQSMGPSNLSESSFNYLLTFNWYY